MISPGKLKERITNAIIEPPEGVTSLELIWWLKGYQEALKMVDEIVDELDAAGNSQRDF